jgi:phosphate/sulfate permease
MDSYLILIYLLFALACVDLIVGVSNDAVNFLNSAVGSKVATIRTILIVSSLGILLGTTFSSGMMEVAQKGIFIPSFFTFDKIMILFLAVMLTDIILLDIYNSLGLPTSTTVSIVFELLGAAFAVGLLVSFQNGTGFEKLNEILNYDSALTIIGGIFLSVFISFFFGTVVQYFARLALTFNLDKSLKRYGAVFSGIAITSITYFLIMKGAKGSTLVSSDQVEWINGHTYSIIFGSMVFWSVLVQVLMWWKKINPLKAVVLLGTFSLAMAFAGNDLVNFIGVAVAGLISYQAWSASGMSGDDYFMTVLMEKVPTPTYLLIGSGVIMVLTLWISAKAKKVTETEVSLGSQEDGDEKFASNFISRALVGGAMSIGRSISTIIPERFLQSASNCFQKESVRVGHVADADKPAFDLVRASVNLVVASILISYATSKKLPLSTTYVSFMVAMGTSLADRAWGRDSAVYRVAGVVNVIVGWLLTAILAFAASAAFGFLLFYTGIAGVITLSALAGFLLIRSHLVFKKKETEKAASNKIFASVVSDITEVIEESKLNTIKNLKTIRKVNALSIMSLIGENRDVLVRSKQEIVKMKDQNDKLQSKIIKYVKRMEKGHLAAGRLYVLVFDLMQDVYQSAELLSEACTKHVINHHPLPDRAYLDMLLELERKTTKYIDSVIESVSSQTFTNYVAVADGGNKIVDFINLELDKQIDDIQQSDISTRMGLLKIKLLLESKDMVVAIGKVLVTYKEFSASVQKEARSKTLSK